MDLSKSTVDVYKRKINIFIKYLSDLEIIVSKYTLQDIINFSKIHLREVNSSTRYIVISSIKNFTRFLNLREINNICKFSSIKLPKKTINEIRLYTKKELYNIFELSKSDQELHIMLILGLFYYFSIKELTNLQKSDLDSKNNVLHTFKRKNIYVNKKYMKILNKIALKNDSSYIFTIRTKQEVATHIRKNIKSKCNIKRVNFKILNNMCIFNHYKFGVTPLELAVYFNINIATANKLHDDYLVNKTKLNRILK